MAVNRAFGHVSDNISQQCLWRVLNLCRSCDFPFHIYHSCSCIMAHNIAHGTGGGFLKFWLF